MATVVQSFEEGAYIITADGEEIPVYDGMEIYPEDQLVGIIITIETDVANDPGADPNTISADDIAAIQQAILEGADPTQVAERTAAGGDTQINGEDGGGSSFVALDRTGNEVDPNAGYDTIPINFFAEESINDTTGVTELEITDAVDTPTDTGPDIPEQPDGPSSNPDDQESPDTTPTPTPEIPPLSPEPEEPEQPEEPEVEPPVDPEPEEPEEPEEEDNSGQNNGWGNGDQDAPGNSEDNNNAENSDNDPPPGISNNPNISNNSEDVIEDEQDSGDNTETTDNGDSSSDIYGDNSPTGVDDVDEEQTINDSTSSDTSDNNGSTDEDSGSDTINPGDVLDEVDDTIPGFGKDNPNAGPKGNNGWGNGDQDAPGNSLENNNAENNLDGLLSPTEQYYDN